MNFGFTNPYTNFSSTDPLTSRARFISRTFDNIAVIFAFFIVVVFVLSMFAAVLSSSFLPMLVIDAMAIGAAYYFYILWSKRAIRLRCRICKEIVLSNTPWVCSYCKKTNSNGNTHSFLAECEHCGNEPKAYKCHHCTQLIFLSEDQDGTNYAYGLNSPHDKPKPDERSTKRQSHQESKEDIQNETEMAELLEKLRKAKERGKERENKTKFEEQKEAFDEFYEAGMGLQDYADILRAKAAEKYKNDPVRLKQAYDLIDAFVRDSI